MTRTKASPSTWTYRFKNGKSTTLLHVDPLQSLASIKAELLSALRATHPDGLLHGTLRIPQDAAHVIIGRPVDIHDPHSGWLRIDAEEPTGESRSTAKPNGEGPGRKRKSGGPEVNGIGGDTSPKALGLLDNAVLAYKFRGERVRRQGDELEDEEDEGLGGMDEDEFDVVIASYEDDTGVVNEGDVGSSPPPFTG